MRCPNCNSRNFRHRSTTWSPYICNRCGEEFGDTNWGCLTIPIELLKLIVYNPIQVAVTIIILVTMWCLFIIVFGGDFRTTGEFRFALIWMTFALSGVSIYVFRRYIPKMLPKSAVDGWRKRQLEIQEREKLKQNPTQQSKICSICNTGNDQNAEFCTECGGNLSGHITQISREQSKICSICNTGNDQNTEFCTECGGKLSGQITQIPREQSKICSICNTGNDLDSAFCKKCGSNLNHN